MREAGSAMINIKYWASENPELIDTLKINTKQLQNKELQDLMTTVADESSAYQAGNYVMTDDKAPVELLGMQVIDQIIQEEVAYYKQIYKENGLQGLLKEL